jgi:hypothetical protein
MDHRLFAVLVIVCFALEGAGCASESQRESREQILMPMQTGSTLQRRVMIDTGGVPKKSKKKKKEKEPKRTTPKPTPASEPEPAKPERVEPERPEETPTPAPPDRFR